MITCFSTLGCPDMSLSAAVALADRHRMRALEVRALSGGIDLVGALTREFDHPERMKDTLDTAGDVRVCVWGASLRLTEPPDPMRRREIEGILPWAEAFGGGIFRVFDGRFGSSPEGLAHARENLRWWQRITTHYRARSTLAVETHDSLLTCDALRLFLAEVAEVGILWDAHHTWRCGGESPEATMDVIGSRGVHVHVKDSVALPGQSPSYRYVLPGVGEYPWAGLRAALDAHAYRGEVSLEWERHWHRELPDLGQALDAARTHRWLL